MTLRHRAAVAVPLMLDALLAGSTTALAASPPLLPSQTIFDGALAAPKGTYETACHRAYRPGHAGVATRSLSVSGPGTVTVKLAGDEGDWDVAVFDQSGRALAADASPDAQEVALGYTVGGTLNLQACRRSGDAASIPASLEFAAVRPAALEQERANPPQLVSVLTPTKAQKDQLLALDLDLTEHGSKQGVGVVLHNKQDEDTLRKAGLRWRVLVSDLSAQSKAQRTADRRFAARTTRSVLPSGRDTYRTLADYNAELKDLAAKNPNLVRPFTLPNKTWMGKDVLGIEITENVNRNDGKPAFVNIGAHHAREWPSGELSMEWAIELVKGFKSGDARATNIVRNSRNIVVPIVNADGFEASRNAGPTGGRDESVDDTVYIVGGASTGGEYRRKNCRLPDDSEAGNCATSAGLAENGVDPNRNYGGLWGGPGADPSNPLVQTYRGPGPFSEPESRNIQALVSRNQVTTLVTNHTTAALVLRAPGLAALGDPVDENRGYKALGDAMAKHNGYFSQKGFELYDTTGTTEDWSYNATGGFGFTFEIYCGLPNYDTGDCDDPAFHPLYATTVKEWTGDNDTANHTNEPGPNHNFDGKGNGEAYYIAAESTLNEQRHSVLEGSAPAGSTLRLTKQFKTETFPQPPDNKPLLVDDKLETVYDVGSDGRVRWHVNPSTRPIVAKATGVPNAGQPSPPQSQTGGITGSSTTADDPDDGAAVATGEPDSTGTTSYNDHPITVPATGDNASMTVRVSWPLQTGDWDIKLYEDTNDNHKSDEGEPIVGTSQTGPSNFEEVSAHGAPRLQAGKNYVLRVNNFAASAADNYDVDITFAAPPPFKPAQVESYTLTCEQGGRVFDTQQVQIDRGQVKQLDLSACTRAIAAAGSAQPISAPGQGTPACASAAILRSVKATAAGGGVRFAFSTKVAQKVNVDVFQVALRRKVIGERLVARFRGRAKSFTWNGTSKRKRVQPGVFFARYSIRLPNGQRDIRRKVLQLNGGRFTARPDFYRRDTCGLLRSYKLERPAFGGTTEKPLRVAFRLTRAANVRIQVLRGNRSDTIVRSKRFAAGRTHRASLRSAGLRKGDYRVQIRVSRAGSRTVTSTLTSRRL
jgi:hypothetical protein